MSNCDQPANNEFLLASQFCFNNSLPLVVIESKHSGVHARAAFDENLTYYKTVIPQLFWFATLLIASNGMNSRIGLLTAHWERWVEWKRIEREDEPRWG